MESLQNKIIELSKLLANNVLTSNEFNRIVELLKSTNNTLEEQSEDEIKYNNYFQEFIIPKFKSPATAIYPPYNISMIKEVSGLLDSYKAIDTYLDSQNSFGAMIRTGIRIEIDDDFNYLGFKYKSPGMFSMWI